MKEVKHTVQHRGARPCVYLLFSKGKFYIGYTMYAPWYRLLQHNGLARGGAWRTQRHRPWRIVFYLDGFSTGTHAKRLEKHWQAGYRGQCKQNGGQGGRAMPGVVGKVRMLVDLLHSPIWCGVSLVGHIVHTAHASQAHLRAEEAVGALLRGPLTHCLLLEVVDCAHGPMCEGDWVGEVGA